MEIDVIRANERFRGWGQFGDNAALAFFIGSFTKFLDPAKGDPMLRGALIVAGVVLGIAFLRGAWHIRGLIQPED